MTVARKTRRFARRLIRRLRAGEAMYRRDRLHHYWSQPAPEGGAPERLVHHTNRSQALAHLMARWPKSSRILEVGCNAGRNLAHLHDEGWVNVAGVEINPHAIDLMRSTFPQLDDADIRLGPAEDVLPSFGDDEFDLVFTMAVVPHIHPDSTGVFDDMARVTRNLLLIETSGLRSRRQYPHDPVKVFRSRGFHLDREVPMNTLAWTKGDSLSRYVAYHLSR